MYILFCYYVRMIKRTTIELDLELLARAKRALGEPTTRATVEEALRRAADSAGAERASRSTKQQRYLMQLGVRADLGLLGTEEMWR